MAGVQRGGKPDCKRIALSGGSALQEFFNFLLLNNSALVRSMDNIPRCNVCDQLNPSDRCRGNALQSVISGARRGGPVRPAWRGNTLGVVFWGAEVRQCGPAQLCHTLGMHLNSSGYVNLRAFYELMVIKRNDSAVFYWGNKENSEMRSRTK